MQQKRRSLSWRSLLFGCGRAENVPRSSGKKVTKQVSMTRLSFSDICSSVSPKDLSVSLVGSNLYIFTLAELKVATKNFSMTNYVGEGGFGPVYKGLIDEKVRPGITPEAVAVKLLDLEGMQGHKEWLTEVIFLGQLRHPNLVKLVGYCYENEHRLLVYEFMTMGNLENRLFKRVLEPLPWKTRMQIALGAAKGLEFLHEAEQPVIYRDFKASNILLDKDYKAKLSDFGLAKDGPQGDDTHVSTRIMGTYGYAAPEYIMTGHLTAKSDVFSFGVVLLELLTGRRCVDKTRPTREQNLVEWAKPYLNETKKLDRIMDPYLEGQYSRKGAQRAAALAYQCLSHSPKSRPHTSAIVQTLEAIQDLDDIPPTVFSYVVLDDSEKEEDKKVTTPKECKRKHKSRQRTRNRIKSLKQTSYSDTALYKISPRHVSKGA